MAKNIPSKANPRPRRSAWNPTARHNVPVSTPVVVKTRSDQVKNNEGGYVFQVGDLAYLRRFLILGTEDGTYYASGRKLTKDAAKSIAKFLNKKTFRTAIDEVVRLSDEGSARQDYAIYVMAVAAVHDDVEVRTYALQRLNKVCRIGTHLFTFATYISQLKSTTGWGRSLKRAFANWYNEKDAKSVAYQICKYASRAVEGELPWSHRDILRKAHVVPSTKDHDKAFRYAVKGEEAFDPKTWRKIDSNKSLRYISGHQQMKCMLTNFGANLDRVSGLISEYDLARESIPTEILNNACVYDALLQKMPLTATIRNLGKMTELGVLAPLSDNTDLVVERITNAENIQKSRIHPVALLAAMRTYRNGAGFRGSLSWKPVPAINKALEDAFYASFKYVRPTNQRILLGVDMSGSMGGPVNGVPFLTTSEAAACMTMAIVRGEPKYHVIGFNRFPIDNLDIQATDRLDDVMRKIRPHGGTDCAAPIDWANIHNVDADLIVILTDNDTWTGKHPYLAFNAYRKNRNLPDCKLAVVSMTATNQSIADPKDSAFLDMVGFDTNVPDILSKFAREW